MKNNIYKILTKPYIIVMVMLFAPLLNFLDRNFSFFFGLSVVGLIAWSSNYNWSLFGFTKKITQKTIVYAFLFTIALIIFDSLLYMFISSILGEPDISSLGEIKGNTLNYIILLVIIWTIVAFGEEFLFTGYYFKWLAQLFGGTKSAWLIAGIIVAIYFGASHYYQGISGIISISIFTMIHLYVFYKNKDNLWIAILMHGFHDTIGVTLLYLDMENPVVMLFEQLST